MPSIEALSASVSRNPSLQTASSERACSATSSSAPVSAPIVRIGTSGCAWRSSNASVAAATASIAAPPRSAASALSAIPCP